MKETLKGTERVAEQVISRVPGWGRVLDLVRPEGVSFNQHVLGERVGRIAIVGGFTGDVAHQEETARKVIDTLRHRRIVDKDMPVGIGTIIPVIPRDPSFSAVRDTSLDKSVRVLGEALHEDDDMVQVIGDDPIKVPVSRIDDVTLDKETTALHTYAGMSDAINRAGSAESSIFFMNSFFSSQIIDVSPHHMTTGGIAVLSSVGEEIGAVKFEPVHHLPQAVS